MKLDLCRALAATAVWRLRAGSWMCGLMVQSSQNPELPALKCPDRHSRPTVAQTWKARPTLRTAAHAWKSYLSLWSFQVRVCWAASPWCCWWRCCGCRRCCCSCCTSAQHGGTVAENRGVNVSKQVSSTRAIRLSVVSGWSTRRSTTAEPHRTSAPEQ